MEPGPDAAHPVQKEDMDKILATFKKWDKDGNGSISKKELTNIFDHLGVQDKDRQTIFESIDTSQNGRVEYEEFVAWLYGTMCPAPVRSTALGDRYHLSVDSVTLELEDDPSFSGWFHDASTIRPFLLFCDALTKKRYFKSCDGLGLKSQLSFNQNKAKLDVWEFELGESGQEACEIEICLPKTMPSLRGHQTIGSATLSMETVGPKIAEGLGAAVVSIDVFAEKDVKETKETKPNSNGAEPSRLVARLSMKLVEKSTPSGAWAKRNVQSWKQHGLPQLELEGVCKVLRALNEEMDRNLLKEALDVAAAHLTDRLRPFRTWKRIQAEKELDHVLKWLQKLEHSVTNPAARRQSAKEFEQLGERLASGVLSVSLEVADHELMRAALSFACAVDPHLPAVRDVEATFKGMMRFPNNIKLHDLLHASDADLAPAEPAQHNLDLATDGKLPSISDDVRFGVRDETAERVLAMLGRKTQLNYRKGVTYAKVAMEVIGNADFVLPDLLKSLMADVKLFPGEKELVECSIPELLAAQARDKEALLGRFDVIAAPARADYDDHFLPLTKASPSSPLFGADPKEPIGGPGWFWIFHAAAINIGESESADDFIEYSMPPDPTYRGRRGHNRWLDEERYVRDMGLLWHRVLEAACHMNVEDMILFPFGMGAFLRNLHKLDSRYSDAAAIRRLRYAVAFALFEAAAKLCLPDTNKTGMNLHLCLVDCSLESRSNHNVFVEAAAAKAVQVPLLAKHLHFHRNCDALELARRLSDKPPGRPDLDLDVRKVGLLNGANNKQLGNHWFGHGARSAIDENLHRRSAAMSAASLLINLSTEPRFRSPRELSLHVQVVGGKLINLVPFPTKASRHSSSHVLSKLRVVPYGILGSQMASSGVQWIAAEPSERDVVVDPAGLPYIQSGPSGAGGASGQLYKWLGISSDSSFPEPVKTAIKETSRAKFHSYEVGKNIIHVVGPDFRSRTGITRVDAVAELAKAYCSTLKEFAACGIPRLRCLPISSSIFAGPFEKQMPEITVQAVQQGFSSLEPDEQDTVLNAEAIEMCIFVQAEFDDYSTAFCSLKA
mmetsp:Transcript_66287/g.156037  ORF Transcript_66287/g.156037 Transcript_66287/m.156037 type:complete len:1066 (+) Transcript_66287:69-3266(+)